MSLKEIACQDKAIKILQKAYTSDKIAGAYIFAGRDGVGKFKTAGEWSKLLLCFEPEQDGKFTDSCGRCRSCRLFEAGNHPDFQHVYKELREYTRDGKDKSPPVDLPIDVVREFLVERVSNKPGLSRKRIFVVSEAEKLNASSQNALLKVLEEPPEYCSIILICTKPENLFDTTRSRCQTISFGPIEEDIILNRLGEYEISSEAARFFTRFSMGSLGHACQLAELEASATDIYETKRKVVENIYGIKHGQVLKLAEWFLLEARQIADKWSQIDDKTSKSDINRRAEKLVLDIVAALFRDLMHINTGSSKNLINSDQQEEIMKLAERFCPERCASKIDEICMKIQWIDSNVNSKLVFEHLLFSLTDSDTISV